jgi:hypothetical protein
VVEERDVIDKTRPHLGGDVDNGDARSWCPKVWEVLAPPGTRVLDVGCGNGHALRWFADHGCIVEGVDGIGRNDARIYTHDFTLGPFLFARQDLIWSCEFLEHVEEKFVPNIMTTFKQATRVAVTAAPPGQPGYHHVNCQWPSYWHKVFADNGFKFNAELTNQTKHLNLRTWWEKNGMIFDVV